MAENSSDEEDLFDADTNIISIGFKVLKEAEKNLVI